MGTSSDKLGRPLDGPHPRDVFPPLARPLIVRSLRQALSWYAASGGSTTQTILAACRAWAWAAAPSTGDVATVVALFQAAAATTDSPT